MINKVKGTEEFEKQLSQTIKLFFEKMYLLWDDYFFQTSDEHGYSDNHLSKEEAIRITKEFDNNRLMLVDSLSSAFAKQYKPVVNQLLKDLNETIEKLLQPYYELNCSFENKLKEPIDILIIVGDPHMCKTNIIFDIVDDKNQNDVTDILLNRYKGVLDNQAALLRQREKEVEVMWDDLYCINFINKEHPTLIPIHSIVVRKY